MLTRSLMQKTFRLFRKCMQTMRAIQSKLIFRGFKLVMVTSKEVRTRARLGTKIASGLAKYANQNTKRPTTSWSYHAITFTISSASDGGCPSTRPARRAASKSAPRTRRRRGT